MSKYDVVIIGGGAAGMSAALYTCRKKLKTVVISVDIGGQTLLTNHIENYPGIETVEGPKLMSHFQKQAIKFGADFITGRVSKIDKRKKNFIINLENKEKYEAKTVILAFGKTTRKLGIPGEDKFFGRGVSTCATCDAPLFGDKAVAVVGGGNSALEAAELLNEYASKIYLIHRRKEFRGDEVTFDKIKKMKKVEILTETSPLEVKGDSFVKGLIVKGVKTKKEKELKVDGIFVEIGWNLDTKWLKGFVKLNKNGEIVIDSFCRTSEEGVFAAGDVTTVPYKQIIISAGEGAKAGLEAYKHIKGIDVVVDWK